MKRLFALAMLLAMFLTALTPAAGATETQAEPAVRDPGQCGENLTWSYSGGTLTISGSGEMDDYADTDAPWLQYKEEITRVVFSGSVTSVGACAFMDYDALKDIDFGEAMHTVGEQAFKSCEGLESIILPASFRRFGKECFRGCENLRNVWCKGGMPSFNGNCLWDTSATVYYPHNNAWPMDAVWQVLNSYQNKIIIQGGYPPEEKTVESTTEATEPVTEPVQTTAPAETEPAVTEAVATEPETTPPTTEETEAVETTAATEETKAQWMEEMEQLQKAQEESQQDIQERSSKKTGILVGICILSGVLSLMLIGILVFRRRSY